MSLFLYYSESYVSLPGAELFAKRRKRSEKWVVAETNGTQPPTAADIPTSPAPTTPITPVSNLPPPSYLPETAQRAQHNQKLDEIQARSRNHVSVKQNKKQIGITPLLRSFLLLVL